MANQSTPEKGGAVSARILVNATSSVAPTSLTFHPGRDKPDQLKAFLVSVVRRYEEDRRKAGIRTNTNGEKSLAGTGSADVKRAAKKENSKAKQNNGSPICSSSNISDEDTKEVSSARLSQATTAIVANIPPKKRKQYCAEEHTTEVARNARMKTKHIESTSVEAALEASALQLQKQFQTLQSSNDELKGHNQELREGIAQVKLLQQQQKNDNQATLSREADDLQTNGRRPQLIVPPPPPPEVVEPERTGASISRDDPLWGVLERIIPVVQQSQSSAMDLELAAMLEHRMPLTHAAAIMAHSKLGETESTERGRGSLNEFQERQAQLAQQQMDEGVQREQLQDPQIGNERGRESDQIYQRLQELQLLKSQTQSQSQLEQCQRQLHQEQQHHHQQEHQQDGRENLLQLLAQQRGGQRQAHILEQQQRQHHILEQQQEQQQRETLEQHLQNNNGASDSHEELRAQITAMMQQERQNE